MTFGTNDDSSDSENPPAQPPAPRIVPAGFEGIERNEGVDFTGVHGLGVTDNSGALQGFDTTDATDDSDAASLLGLQTNEVYELPGLEGNSYQMPEPAAPAEPELDIIDLDVIDLDAPEPVRAAKPAAPTVAVPAINPASLATRPVPPTPPAYTPTPSSSAASAAEPAAEPAPVAAPTTPAAPRILCPRCGKPRGETYFEVDGAVVCTACRNRVKATQTRLNSWKADGKPLAFGIAFGAAGALVYAALVAFLPIDIALAAPLCAYLVAMGIRRGAGGGSRQLQWLAAVVTWYVIGLGYAPVTGKHRLEHVALTKARADSTAAVERRIDSVRIAQQLGTADTTVDMATSKATFVRDAGPLISADSAMKRYRPSPLNVLGAGAMVAVSAVWYPVIGLIAARWLGIIGAAFVLVSMWFAFRQLEGREPVITGPHHDPPSAA